MRRITTALICISTVIVFLSLDEAWAQNGNKSQGNRGRGNRMGYKRNYDIETVETISGVVTSVDRINSSKAGWNGLHLMVKTEQESISVHLGPEWFLEDQDMVIEIDDDVEITGSRINFEEKPAIIAAQVKKEKQNLKLRNTNGIPVWSGRRQRR